MVDIMKIKVRIEFDYNEHSYIANVLCKQNSNRLFV
jgi:hypothetical protein